MGFRLANEVLDLAPDDLTPAERLVLSVLAGFVVDESSRECWPGMDKLVRRTGLKPDSLRKVFQRLAKRGLDPRVPLGTDKNGRNVFAHETQRTTYRIPVFESRDDHPATGTEEAGPASRHPEPRGGTVVPQRRDGGPSEAGPPSPPEVVKEEEDSSPTSHQTRGRPERDIPPLLQKLMTDHGASEREATAILTQVRAEGRIRNLAAWASSETGSLDLKQRLADLRQTTAAPADALPPWCGQCGDSNPAARYNPRFRRTADGNCCPDCHPELTAA